MIYQTFVGFPENLPTGAYDVEITLEWSDGEPIQVIRYIGPSKEETHEHPSQLDPALPVVTTDEDHCSDSDRRTPPPDPDDRSHFVYPD